jgi:hypothetical protein
MDEKAKARSVLAESHLVGEVTETDGIDNRKLYGLGETSKPDS